ncbi:MAG: hypothetical protein N2561_08585 [Bacteroidetes bacterium]|nr:hypothetical protein [Rhodothermia bacterium]MCS7155336.1 hypothetical protein [Bacteroidota bacterium]MCX7907571.1 hypothetical protein [Bacteroidota bacterium]MDW8138565.1 hypothetical protein [Bacteroidota bacterium]MDW8284498.1 hypothetical protein [Bacteroidota bacterium]
MRTFAGFGGIVLLGWALKAPAQPPLEAVLRFEQRQPVWCQGRFSERLLRLEARYRLEPPNAEAPFVWLRATGSGRVSLDWAEPNSPCAPLWHLEQATFEAESLPLLLLAPEAEPDTVYLYLYASPEPELGRVPLLRPQQGPPILALREILEAYRGRDYRSHPGTARIYGLPLARRALLEGPVWLELRDSIPESGSRVRLRLGIGPPGRLEGPMVRLLEAPRFLTVGQLGRIRVQTDPPGGELRFWASDTLRTELIGAADGLQIMVWEPGPVRVRILYTAPDGARAETEYALVAYRTTLRSPDARPPSLILGAQYPDLPPAQWALSFRIEPESLLPLLRVSSSEPHSLRARLQNGALWLEGLRPGRSQVTLQLAEGPVLWQDSVRVGPITVRPPNWAEPVLSRPSGVTVQLQTGNRLSWEMPVARAPTTVLFSLSGETALKAPGRDSLDVFGRLRWPVSVVVRARLPNWALRVDGLLEGRRAQLGQVLEAYWRYAAGRKTGTALDSLGRWLSVRALRDRLWAELRPVVRAHARLEGELVALWRGVSSTAADTLRLLLEAPEQTASYRGSLQVLEATALSRDTLWTPAYTGPTPTEAPVSLILQGRVRLVYAEQVETARLRTRLPPDLERSVLDQFSPAMLERDLAPYREALGALLRTGFARLEVNLSPPSLEPAEGARWLLLFPQNPQNAPK